MGGLSPGLARPHIAVGKCFKTFDFANISITTMAPKVHLSLTNHADVNGETSEVHFKPARMYAANGL